jgi:hypothetical protein
MLPFTTEQTSKRISIETKAINVTYKVYLDYVLRKLIPVIKSIFPCQQNQGIGICIQHDNGPSHFHENYPAWRHIVDHEVNWRFTLLEEPANALDTNILELGFFRSIHRLLGLLMLLWRLGMKTSQPL